ncbi:hypothetical protein C4D60_Mb10t03190 [Musa balbisiana]|uniref:Uncharacterized protein n=1 Tax=Musa balbisiana TaxID=52838 RepID=A0A4S8IUA4_MUSBA|nr:hypothetical protein C4D60_Mb10t03190 [Musa balbisiana]
MELRSKVLAEVVRSPVVLYMVEVGVEMEVVAEGDKLVEVVVAAMEEAGMGVVEMEVEGTVEAEEVVTAVAEMGEVVTEVEVMVEAGKVAAVGETAEAGKVVAAGESIPVGAETAEAGTEAEAPARTACTGTNYSPPAAEAVVGEDDDGDRGVAEVVRDVEGEPVVVDEDGVEGLVEQLARDAALELVEPDVEEFQRRKLKEDPGELAGEAVVADVDLEETSELAELVGDGAAEAVPGNVGVVEVDAGDDGEGAVAGERGAVDAVVVADVGAYPVAGEVVGIGEDGLLPSLQSDVGGAKAGVGEVEGRVDRHPLAAVAVLVEVVQQLPPTDESGLGVREAMAAESSRSHRRKCRGRDDEEEEEEMRR